jgi:AraC-like DNA-binding protein
VLRAAGLEPDLYDDSDARIDGFEFQRLLTALEQELNDAFLGFTEQRAKLALYREQSRARFRCETLGEAIKVSTQFREAVRNDVTYEYLSDPERRQFTLTVSYRLRRECDAVVFYLHRLMLIYKYFCWLIGRRISLSHVSFTFPPLAAEDNVGYAEWFCCPVRFGQPANGLTFDSSHLRSPIVRTESEEVDFVGNYPNWFSVPGEDRSWARRVEREILRMQSEGLWCPTIAEVGSRLSVNARALRRELARQSLTFQAIRSRLRRDAALHLLVTTDLPVTMVGPEIGFAEPGDFTRAFKNWMNCTPSEYRRRHATDKTAISAAPAGVTSLHRWHPPPAATP